MKKTLLMLAMIVAGYSTYAQTNTFPSSGNVGIGNTSPGTQLELRNGSGLAVIASNAKIMLSDITAGMYLRMDNASNLQITNNGFSPLVSFMQSGNVGIGTTTPTQSLDVNGNIGIKGNPGGTRYLITDETNSGTTHFTIQAGAGSATYGGAINLYGQAHTTNPGWVQIGLGYGAGSIGTSSEGRFTINDQGLGQGIDLFTVLRTGNVGIGTTAPDSKLSVAGTIHSKEVKVDLIGWPDFVFKPTYQLLSLSSLKTYIDKNQRLPEMPSEQEVAKDGINLGEMVKLQTQKIEELTLYLIQQKEESDKQNKLQQDQINELKSQLAKIIK